jgi:hypothetical protein
MATVYRDSTPLTDAQKASLPGIAAAIRTKMYGKDVRETMAAGLELVGNTVQAVAQQAATSLDYGYFQDGPQARTNTTVSQVEWNGASWVQFVGDTLTPSKGLKWEIPYSNFPDFFNTPIKISFDFQSSIAQNFDLRIDFWDKDGKSLKSDLIEHISFNAFEYRQITAAYETSKVDNVSLIEVNLVATSTDIGKCLIKDAICIPILRGERQLDNDNLLDTVSPESTTSSTRFNYVRWIGKNWLKLTDSSGSQYKGIEWKINFDNFQLFKSEFFNRPWIFKFLAQSSIETTNAAVKWSINIGYHSADGTLLGTDVLKNISFKAYEYQNILVSFVLNPAYQANTAYFDLQIVSNDTKDIGTFLVADECLKYNFKTISDLSSNDQVILKNDFANGIDDALPFSKTVLSSVRYLGGKFLKVVGDGSTQYQGVNFVFDVDPQKEMYTYGLDISFLIQSATDQDLSFNLIYYDDSWNCLGTTVVNTATLNQWEFKNFNFKALPSKTYLDTCSKIAFQIVQNGTNFGTLLIGNLLVKYNFKTVSNPPQNYGLPEVHLDGDFTGISGDDYVNLNFDYVKNGTHITGYAKTKWQGDSSLQWNKKAYKIKVYEDSAMSNKLNFQPQHRWSADNSWNLKAYVTDGLLCRDPVSANIGAAIWSAEKSIPDGVVTTDNFGFIDGFPVVLFINGAFQGIYSFNIAKGDYGKTKAIIDGANYTDVTEFKTYPSGGDAIDGTNFEMVDPDDPTDDIKAGFNAMLNFAVNSTDADFKANIDTYLDKESLIDYYIFSNVIGNVDAWGKNQTFFSYDLKKWYIHPYDLDTTLGGQFDGTLVSKPTAVAHGSHQLFVRLENNFGDDIKKRYTELRSWLTPEFILKMYRKWIDEIGDENYQREYALWNNPSKDTYTWQQLTDYVLNQFKVCDAAWLQ